MLYREVENKLKSHDTQLEQILYQPLVGELGVKNIQYKYGDVRRYGIFPDGVTNWNRDTTYIDIIQKNSANLGFTIFFPQGIYNSELNLYTSNVKVEFEEGCEFTGLLHFGSLEDTSIENIKIKGTPVTYDRFGTFKIDGLEIDGNVHVKSVPEKALNFPGLRTRGAHIYYSTKNFSCEELIVDDCDQNGFSSDAAVSIDASDPNTYADNIKIKRIRVKKSDIHGVYLIGNNYKIEEILVEEYGKGEYRPGQTDANVIGGNGNAQSKELKGVWLNRVGLSKVGRIIVKQNTNDVRPNAKYDVLLDETGNGGNKTVEIGSIYCPNVRGNSRGVSVNDKNFLVAFAEYNIGYIEVANESGRTNEEGYGLVTVNDYSKGKIDKIKIINPDSRDSFVYNSSKEMKIGIIDCGEGKRRGALINGKVILDKLDFTRLEALDGVPSVEITTRAETSVFNNINANANALVNCTALKNLSPYATIKKFTTRYQWSDDGAVILDKASYGSLENFTINPTGNKGVGLTLIGTLTNYSFVNGQILNAYQNIKQVGALTRCCMNNVNSGGGIVSTDIPKGTLQLFNCNNVELTA